MFRIFRGSLLQHSRRCYSNSTTSTSMFVVKRLAMLPSMSNHQLALMGGVAVRSFSSSSSSGGMRKKHQQRRGSVKRHEKRTGGTSSSAAAATDDETAEDDGDDADGDVVAESNDDDYERSLERWQRRHGFANDGDDVNDSNNSNSNNVTSSVATTKDRTASTAADDLQNEPEILLRLEGEQLATPVPLSKARALATKLKGKLVLANVEPKIFSVEKLAYIAHNEKIIHPVLEVIDENGSSLGQMSLKLGIQRGTCVSCVCVCISDSLHFQYDACKQRKLRNSTWCC